MRPVATSLLLSAFALFATSFSAFAQDTGLLQPGTAAPNFVADGWNGGTARLSDYRGRIVVLDFWATWCGPCNRAMPELQDIADRYRGDNVVVLGLCTWDTAANADAWIRSHPYNFTFAVDPAGEDDSRAIARTYEVTGIPSTFVIDQNGNIAASDVCMSEEEMATALDSLGARDSRPGAPPSGPEPRSYEVGRSDRTLGSSTQPVELKGYMSAKAVDPYGSLTEAAALAKAHAFIDKGRFDNAAALATSMDKRGLTGKLGPIYNALGDHASSASKFNEAWGWYMLTIQHSTDSTYVAHAHFGIADYFKTIGEPDKATAEFQAIIDLPGVADADKSRAQSELAGKSSS